MFSKRPLFAEHRDPPHRCAATRLATLVALAQWCDFLVVSCVGSPETRHLVSPDVLSALGPQGILVNIARGYVVDQAALIRALEAGAVGGAGLDVLEGEPGAPEALRRREEVVFSPHVGSATIETRRTMEELVIENVRSFFASGQMRTPVVV